MTMIAVGIQDDFVMTGALPSGTRATLVFFRWADFFGNLCTHLQHPDEKVYQCSVIRCRRVANSHVTVVRSIPTPLHIPSRWDTHIGSSAVQSTHKSTKGLEAPNHSSTNANRIALTQARCTVRRDRDCRHNRGRCSNRSCDGHGWLHIQRRHFTAA